MVSKWSIQVLYAGRAFESINWLAQATVSYLKTQNLLET